MSGFEARQCAPNITCIDKIDVIGREKGVCWLVWCK